MTDIIARYDVVFNSPKTRCIVVSVNQRGGENISMLGKIAAALAALTAAIHIIIGGSDALAPTLAANLPAPAEGAMHAVWHMVSAFLLWSVAAFWRGGAVAIHFGALWLISAAIFIYVGLWQDGLNGLVVNPQWTILAVTGIFVLAAEYFAQAKPKPQS